MKHDNRNEFDRSKWTAVQVTIDWIESCLVNDENASDEEMGQYFMENGLDKETTILIMRQRDRAFSDPFGFKLDIEGLLLEGAANGIA